MGHFINFLKTVGPKGKIENLRQFSWKKNIEPIFKVYYRAVLKNTGLSIEKPHRWSAYLHMAYLYKKLWKKNFIVLFIY